MAGGKAAIREKAAMFRCPLCGEGMTVDNSKSLVCGNDHCFDIAKKGYINFLQRPVKSEYDKDMFAARHWACREGFFAPVLEGIVDLVVKGTAPDLGGGARVLDAGCGEGSHLAGVVGALEKEMAVNITGAGIDISKEGIQLACRNYPAFIWLVADLTNIPFKDKQFALILNILSPSNYGEFSRVLADDGVLIKVVPGREHLYELRKVFNMAPQEACSREGVIAHFQRNFQVAGSRRVRVERPVNVESLKQIIRMTPLTWGVDLEGVPKASGLGIDCVTLDLTILLGRKWGR